MINWPTPKDPDEAKDYRIDWTDRLEGDTILSSSAALVTGAEAGLSIASDNGFQGASSIVWLTGGTAGMTGLVRVTITTTGARTFEETAALRIINSSDPVQSDLEKLRADRAAVNDAKINYLKGGQVKQVTRAGRTIIYNTTSVADFDAALARLDNDIAALDATCTGRRRRRALSVSF